MANLNDKEKFQGPGVVDVVKQSSENAKEHVIRFKNRQIVTAFLGGVGAVFFVFGTERLVETLPIISEPVVEIAAGIFLLSISGLLIKKLGSAGE